ncbi:hypothetical protein JIQ42_01258 [Leishmania sp. Namibia]|uniref:hypothetical protein n=1 Tax=Leishmania sp. Namibia TaxID=2802991 RepID=UPI001B50C284|nr:hypothetical protein JIQ42_01258 [Leishmania sp. Namibia]
MLAYVENYFDLRKSFVFYGAYHHNWKNQMIHVLFVPVIFTTALSFLARVPITGGVDLSHIVAAFYAISFIKMEPVAGALYLPVIAAMEYLGSKVLFNRVPTSIGIHVLGWAAQILGHKLAEGRQPAFTEDPPQAFHAAVFFVWLEVLFFLGYRPAEKAELEKLIRKRIANMNTVEATGKTPSAKGTPKTVRSSKSTGSVCIALKP